MCVAAAYIAVIVVAAAVIVRWLVTAVIVTIIVTIIITVVVTVIVTVIVTVVVTATACSCSAYASAVWKLIKGREMMREVWEPRSGRCVVTTGTSSMTSAIYHKTFSFRFCFNEKACALLFAQSFPSMYNMQFASVLPKA